MTTQQSETKVCLVCKQKFAATESKCPDDGSDLVPAHQDKLVGTEFAERYHILKVAGHGGMSTVYKAKHTYMERFVALKLLHLHLIDDPSSIQRFQQESKAASSLCHPNIITVFDFGVTSDGQAFLVMDYLDGPTLGDLIDRGGSVPEGEALDLFRQTCKGLLHAHTKGVVHRDLKPRNLCLTVDEDSSVLLKIVDFGIAKVLPADGEKSQHLTRTGEVFGSPIYMSPEQCSGEKIDHRSDIYSLGCVMYETLTGLPPHIGQNPIETMSLHVNEPPVPFADLDMGLEISERLEEAVFTCLEKSPGKRYQSISEVLESLSIDSVPTAPVVGQTGTIAMRLNDIASGDTDKPTGAGTTKPRRKRSRARGRLNKITAVLASLFLLHLSFIILYQGPDEDPGSPAMKMPWQLELSFGRSFVLSGMYGIGIPLLEFADWHCQNLDYIWHRPNYDKLSETLTTLALAYSMTGMQSQYEETVSRIANLDRKRWEYKALQGIKDLDRALEYIEQLRKRREPVQAHLSENVLNWAGSERVIVEVARRLDANFAYELEYQLLVKTEKVLEQLYGRDYVGLSDLKLQRAICLKNQDRTSEIDEIDSGPDNPDGLYGRAKEIEEKYARSLQNIKGQADLTPEQASKSPDYIRALLKLGQWQRDRGRLEHAGPNLKKALEAAKLYKDIQPDELAEFYNAYADFFLQADKPEQASHYLSLAKEQRSKSAKTMGMEYIEHNTVESEVPVK